jgi:hypothetical protein
MNSILAAALGGAAGGVLGGLIGAVIKGAARKKNGWQSKVGTVLVIGFGIAGGRIGAEVLQPSLEDQVDKASPLYATLHQYYPTEYSQIVGSLKASQSGASDKLALENAVRPVLSDLVAKHRAQISDKNASDMMGVVVEEATIMRDRDPLSCAAMLNGGKTRISLADALPDSLKEKDLAVSAAVLKQVATAPAPQAPKLPDDQLKSLSLSALATLPEDERQAIVAMQTAHRQPATDVEAKGMCDFTISLVNKAMASPPGTLRAVIAAG